MVPETCEYCWHWVTLKDERWGECHRYPPQCVFAPASHFDPEAGVEHHWPKSKFTEGCGEYRPKELRS
jgi:hypothetical protein